MEVASWSQDPGPLYPSGVSSSCGRNKQPPDPNSRTKVCLLLVLLGQVGRVCSLGDPGRWKLHPSFRFSCGWKRERKRHTQVLSASAGSDPGRFCSRPTGRSEGRVSLNCQGSGQVCAQRGRNGMSVTSPDGRHRQDAAAEFPECLPSKSR